MNRSCGACTACCTLQGVLQVPDHGPKPPGSPCPHCQTGCRIYPRRPTDCSTFTCLWLQGLGEPEDRPDLLGVMFELQDQVVTPFILARTLARGREKGSRVQHIARSLRASGLDVAVFHPDQETGEFYRENVTLETLE